MIGQADRSPHYPRFVVLLRQVMPKVAPSLLALPEAEWPDVLNPVLGTSFVSKPIRQERPSKLLRADGVAHVEVKETPMCTAEEAIGEWVKRMEAMT